MAYNASINSAAEDFTYKGSQIVKNPNFDPYSNWRNALWVWMIPLKLENQGSQGRGGSLSIGGENRPTFAFLAPNSISENINHTWEGFDSIQSRLMGKMVAGAKLLNEGAALKQSIKNIVSNQSPHSPDIPTTSMFDRAVIQAGKIAGTEVPKFKVDTPLRYMDSARRTLQLEFLLMNSAPTLMEDRSMKGHSWKAKSRGLSEVTNIVHDLMMYSAPAIKEGSTIEYEFPYIWRLETAPNGFIIFNYCALESVQPTWKSPYVNGYPLSCELTLTFKDLSPLFRSTIKSGSAIRVIDNSMASNMNDVLWANTFEELKVTSSVNKKDTLKALLNARTKFKRAQAIQKSLASGNAASVLKYFKGRGTDSIRKALDSDTQRKIGKAIPIGKNTPALIQKVPRL